MKQPAPRHIATGVVILGVAGLVYAASIPLKRSGKTWNCQSNLKQIGLSMSQYNRDYDEKYPRAADWMDALRPYIKGVGPNPSSNAGRRASYLCPATDSYVALNVYFDRLSMIQNKSPNSAPLVFDVRSGQFNQNDNGASWPITPIHTTLQTSGNNVLFADGHVELRSVKPTFRAFAPRSTPAATTIPMSVSQAKK